MNNHFQKTIVAEAGTADDDGALIIGHLPKSVKKRQLLTRPRLNMAIVRRQFVRQDSGLEVAKIILPKNGVRSILNFG